MGCATATSSINGCYHIATEELILSFNQSLSPGAVPVQWKELSATTHYYTTTIPYSNPPVIIGGSKGGVPTSAVSLYDREKNSWRKVDSLTTARHCVGVALLNSHSLIVIGGASGGVGVEAAIVSSLSKVEIGTIIPNQ